jgi:plasmid stabilization system protein ParE
MASIGKRTTVKELERAAKQPVARKDEKGKGEAGLVSGGAPEAGNDYYRIRFFSNHYRIVFRLFYEQQLVLITRMRHRSDACRGL